jgi:hypothetical protein
LYAKSPLANPNLAEQVEALNRVRGKFNSMDKLFNHFLHNEWIFESVNMGHILKRMSPSESQEFLIDVRKVDWEACTRGFCYGIRRYVVKEDAVAPSTGYFQMLKKNNI